MKPLLAAAFLLLAFVHCTSDVLAQEAAQPAPPPAAQPPAEQWAPPPPAAQPAPAIDAQPQAAPAADQPTEAVPALAKKKDVLIDAGEGSVWEDVGEGAFFVGGAAVLGGGALVLMTTKSKSDYDSETDPAKKRQAKERNELYQTLAIASFVTGAVLMSAGGAMWALLGDQEEKKKYSITPIFDGRFAGVGMTGRF